MTTFLNMSDVLQMIETHLVNIELKNQYDVIQISPLNKI